MIHFFRKIRKQLAADNKPLKYMRYAIGEIVLVVIGILIALQINNWNEDRRELIEENKLIVNLRQEFQNNLQNLDSTNADIDNRISSLSKLLISIGDTSSQQFNGEKLDSLLILVSISPKWSRSHLNIRDLESTGKLGRLRNEKMKYLIYDYLGKLEGVKDVEKSSEQSLLSYINYISEFGSWRELDKYLFIKEGGSTLMPSNDHLLMDYKFENVVDDHLVWLRIKVTVYDSIRKHILKIIDNSR